jgi:hypothetical protein
MNYAGVDTVIGLYQPNFVYTVDTTERVQTGMVVTAFDNYWGWGEFIYGKATATITMGAVSTITPTLVAGALEYQMTAAARVASSARPYCVAMASMTVGQFGWFAVSGMVPIKAAASIAAGGSFAIDAGGAGAINAAAATFGVQGAMSVLPSATTSVKTGCSGRSGAFDITIPNAEGWFIGATLTGTGVGASAKIVSVSPDQRTVTVDVANAAAVSGNVTATYTGFIVALISRPAGLGL